MTKSGKSSSAKVSLRDFDPEYEDFGTDAAGMLSKTKKGASLKHGHLGDLKVNAGLAALSAGFEDKKYAGKAVSKKDLYSEEEASYSEMGSEDIQDEYDSEDIQVESEVSEGSSELEDSSLAARLRNLDVDAGEGQIELVAQKNENRNVDKSVHVRNQLLKFDSFTDVRLKLQPILNSVNRLPDTETFAKHQRKSPEISMAVSEINEELDALFHDLLKLSFGELKNDSLDIPEVDEFASKSNSTKKPSALQFYWNEMNRIDATVDVFAQDALQKWHRSSALAVSDLKSKKSLKVLNQDPYQQVQLALQDEARLISRSQLHRDQSKKRIACLEDVSEFTDIFDDNDFYQVLLKDWTASHGSTSSTSGISAVSLSLKKQHREGVDRRASKGRKLRFDVQEKLVNYMVPKMEPAAWNDTKADEFYTSLLGAQS